MAIAINRVGAAVVSFAQPQEVVITHTDDSIVSYTVDGNGNIITSTGGAMDVNLKSSGITLPVSAAALPLPAGAATSANQSTEIANLQTINSLIPTAYDYVSFTYTGVDLTTIRFKTGGASGTLVNTLTLAYTANILQSVTRS